MNEELLRKLEQQMGRRTFLRGSGLAAATLVGVMAFPLLAGAQNQDPQQPAGNQNDPKDDKKDDKAENKSEKAENKAENKEDKKDGDTAENDPFKEIKKDAQGRDYRMCPQCGYNMYKQDRTWTCENCGYSYVE